MEFTQAAPRPAAYGARAWAARSAADRIISAGSALTLAMVIAQTVAQAVDFGFLGLRIEALDSNHHASIFGVISLAAQAAVVVAAAAQGMRSRPRLPWLLLAALVGAVLVLRLTVAFEGGALLPPVALVFVLLCWLTWEETARVRAVVWAGLALLAFSFVVHAVGPPILTALGESGNTWPDQVKGMLKHSAELSGWALVAIGLLAARCTSTAGRSRGS